MSIRLLAFATAGDAVGASEVDVDVDTPISIEALGRALVERYPDLEAIWPRLAVAVDGRLVGGETTIEAGAEVALLPPVSGGAPRRTALGLEPLDPSTVMAAVADPRCGAVVLFTGTVRDHHEGRPVTGITYTAYETMARDTLGRIVEELEEATGARLAIHHRLGAIPAGEPSVVIAAASPHRAEAYDASRQALERLKREVPIWKREQYADGDARWREEEPLARRSS